MKLKCGFLDRKEGLRALSWAQRMLYTGDAMLGTRRVPNRVNELVEAARCVQSRQGRVESSVRLCVVQW